MQTFVIYAEVDNCVDPTDCIRGLIQTIPQVEAYGFLPERRAGHVWYFVVASGGDEMVSVIEVNNMAKQWETLLKKKGGMSVNFGVFFFDCMDTKLANASPETLMIPSKVGRLCARRLQGMIFAAGEYLCLGERYRPLSIIHPRINFLRNTAGIPC